ncbi:MAG: hypothetical protein RR101_02905 [Burkholderiaceae bacterium]
MFRYLLPAAIAFEWITGPMIWDHWGLASSCLRVLMLILPAWLALYSVRVTYAALTAMFSRQRARGLALSGGRRP